MNFNSETVRKFKFKYLTHTLESLPWFTMTYWIWIWSGGKFTSNFPSFVQFWLEIAVQFLHGIHLCFTQTYFGVICNTLKIERGLRAQKTAGMLNSKYISQLQNFTFLIIRHHSCLTWSIYALCKTYYALAHIAERGGGILLSLNSEREGNFKFNFHGFAYFFIFHRHRSMECICRLTLNWPWSLVELSKRWRE